MSKFARGFTLIELLVVMAIIAVLAVVVSLIIDPLEILRRSRDDTRLVDLATIQKAINITIQDNSTLQSDQILCFGGMAGGKCEGKSHLDSASPDGNGWVKVNFTSSQGIAMPYLPPDPSNGGTFHFTYCSNGTSWEIAAFLESDLQRSRMAQDGGINSSLYEIGSNLTLIGPSGLCSY